MRRRAKIISGGQTGADIAALRAAASLGLATGGFAPAKLISDFKLGQYGVVPFVIPGRSASLAQLLVGRSMKNVDVCDAVIAFRPCPSTGTDRTIAYALSRKWRDFVPPKMDKNFAPSTAYKPVFLVTHMDDADACADGIAAFIKQKKATTVNVCGPRACRDVPDYEQRVEAILRIAFAACA
jgi:hypothetical protein